MRGFFVRGCTQLYVFCGGKGAQLCFWGCAHSCIFLGGHTIVRFFFWGVHTAVRFLLVFFFGGGVRVDTVMFFCGGLLTVVGLLLFFRGEGAHSYVFGGVCSQLYFFRGVRTVFFGGGTQLYGIFSGGGCTQLYVFK